MEQSQSLKNKGISDAARARREANRQSNRGGGRKIQGLATIKNTLGRQFIGADPYDIGQLWQLKKI